MGDARLEFSRRRGLSFRPITSLLRSYPEYLFASLFRRSIYLDLSLSVHPLDRWIPRLPRLLLLLLLLLLLRISACCKIR